MLDLIESWPSLNKASGSFQVGAHHLGHRAHEAIGWSDAILRNRFASVAYPVRAPDY